MDVRLSVLLFVVMAGAFAIPPLARRLGLAPVVGELIFGVIIGPTLLDLPSYLGVSDLSFLNHVANVGLLLILFLAGLELDFVELKRQGIISVILGVLIMAGTLLLSFTGIRMMGLPVFLALVLSTSSADVILRVLRSGGHLQQPFGQTMLVVALVADFIALLGIVLYEIYIHSGFSIGMLLFIGLFIGGGVALYLLRLLIWWHPHFFQRLLLGEDPDELGVRSAMALMFAFVVLAAFFGVEAILGSFLAGAVAGFVFRRRGALEEKLAGFGYGFFIPLFYIWVGMSVDLTTLLSPQALLMVAALFALALLIKVVPAFILLLTGRSFREVLGAGVLLSSRLALIIAAAEIGREAGLLAAEPARQEQVYAALILLALLSCTVFPLLFRIIYPTKVKPEMAEVAPAAAR